MNKTKRKIKDSEDHTPVSMSKMLVSICYRSHASNGETAAVKTLIEKVTGHKMEDFTQEQYMEFITKILETK